MILDYFKWYRKLRKGNWKLIEIPGLRFPNYELNIFWVRNLDSAEGCFILKEENY